jgi:hypothetical protein
MEEFKHIVELIKLNLDVKKDSPSFGAEATVYFPDEIHAKYIRSEKYSIVTGEAVVNAHSDSFEMEAVVQVKIYYKGDMVRSSFSQRNKINKRLEILAQGICSNYIQEKLFKEGLGEEENILLY